MSWQAMRKATLGCKGSDRNRPAIRDGRQMARMEMSTLAKAELAAQSGAPDALFEIGRASCRERV